MRVRYAKVRLRDYPITIQQYVYVYLSRTPPEALFSTEFFFYLLYAQEQVPGREMGAELYNTVEKGWLVKYSPWLAPIYG